MDVCATNHEEIAYIGTICPLCVVIDTKDDEIKDLSKQIEENDTEIKDLNQTIADLDNDSRES